MFCIFIVLKKIILYYNLINLNTDSVSEPKHNRIEQNIVIRQLHNEIGGGDEADN